MPPFVTSSGDLNADRRLAYAEALFTEGDAAAAVDLLGQTLALVPGWVAGWYRLAEMAESLGRSAEAAAAYAEALRLDPTDHLGAAIRLDLLREVPVADRMSSAFVETLFDQYAPKFEQSLVDALDYRGPELLAAQLTGPFDRVMDLGCGTGLMGQALRARCNWLEGVDISAEMLRLADAKGIYDRLEKQDLSRLEIGQPRWDLIVAADVFIYLGALERIIAWAVGSLAPGGTLAFTIERHRGEDFVLQRSRRYAHSQAYVERLLTQAGLGRVTAHAAVLRQDRGQPVEALVFVAVAQSVSRREGEATEFA